MSGFLWKQWERKGRTGVWITGYEGEPPANLIVPEQIDHFPVTGIDRFAFAGQQSIRKIRLPQRLETLALFAFQNCVNLESLELFNTTQDYYDGVVRGCTSLKDVIVHCILPDNYIIVREMLRDTDGALRFHLLQDGPAAGDADKGTVESRTGTEEHSTASGSIQTSEWQRLDLTFPEYVSEAREDTMARAIHFSIEGAGMAYRECVSRHSLDLQAYDLLLPRLTEYDFEAAADICLGRLMYPVSLSPAARRQYQTYLQSHAASVLEKEIREQRTEAVRYLTREKLIPEAVLDGAVAAAAKAGQTGICSILMDYQHSLTGGTPAGKLDLDW